MYVDKRAEVAERPDADPAGAWLDKKDTRSMLQLARSLRVGFCLWATCHRYISTRTCMHECVHAGQERQLGLECTCYKCLLPCEWSRDKFYSSVPFLQAQEHASSVGTHSRDRMPDVPVVFPIYRERSDRADAEEKGHAPAAEG